MSFGFQWADVTPNQKKTRFYSGLIGGGEAFEKTCGKNPLAGDEKTIIYG
jgi:hypothetical protein